MPRNTSHFDSFSLGTYLSLYKTEKIDQRDRVFNEIIQASSDTGSSFSPVEIKVFCILTKIKKEKRRIKKSGILGVYISNTNELQKLEKFTPNQQKRN